MTDETHSTQLVFLQCEHVELAPDIVDAIRRITTETVDTARALLPSLSPTLNITIYPYPYRGGAVIDGFGIGGTAMNADWLKVTLDPHIDGGLEHVVTNHLVATLAHELQHCARFRACGLPEGIPESAVFEGLATAFERDVVGVAPPWGTYDDVAIDQWADELLTVGDDAAFDHWFYAHPDGRRWIGYRAGTYLIDRATHASGMNAAELTGVPTDDILRFAAATPR